MLSYRKIRIVSGNATTTVHVVPRKLCKDLPVILKRMVKVIDVPVLYHKVNIVF